jgi:DNA polymerase type B, organellar and viral
MFNLRRFAHIITQKKKTVVPSNFIFFDTETYVKGTKHVQGIGDQILWFGWALAYRTEDHKRTRELWCRFSTPEQFFEFVYSRLVDGKPLFVYAHNMGFDLPIVGFFELYRKLGMSIEFWTIDTPPTIFKCRWEGKTVVFVDTLNYWQMPLAALGESVGCSKAPMPKSPKDRKGWDRYCRRDVEVLDKAITKLIAFVQEHRCGSLAMTLASLSMSAYRHRFMKHQIWIHDRVAICELERNAYYGGLVECFRMGRVPAKMVYNVDITSHYPSVMLNKFPCKLINVMDRPDIGVIRSLLKTKCVIAEVLLSSRVETFPHRKKKKLRYVRGRFKTYLCGPELQRAIDTNSIFKIRKAAIYDSARLFDQFVKYFWHVRQCYLRKRNGVDSFFAKILLNSLYGKFGQRGVSWMDLTPQLFQHLMSVIGVDTTKKKYDIDKIPIDVQPYWNWTPIGAEEGLRLRNPLNNLQVKLAISEHYESFPAISAYVTAYGRERLLELIRIAGQENVYYCDTDSLFTNTTGLKRLRRKRLIAKNVLGKLKIAGQSKTLIIRGLKDYVFANKEKCKGIRKDAKKIAHNVYEQTRFEGIRSVLRRRGGSFIRVSVIRKKLQRHYDKGLVGANGTVRPFTLNEF